MAVFGRSFPLPRRYVNHLVGNVAPASTVRATYVRSVRLPDRPRPFPHVTIERRVGAATTVGPRLVKARLPDAPRPKRGIVIGKPLAQVSNTTLTALTGTYVLTGQAAQFIATRFASAPVKIRLPDRPRPFPHVFISKAPPVTSSNTTLTASQGSYALSGQSALFVTTMPAAQGSMSLTGQAAAFNTTMPAAFGSYTLAGQNAAFSATANVVMAAGIGFYALSGADAGFPNAVLPPPSGFPGGTLWGYWPQKPPKRRKKTTEELLVDLVEPPKTATFKAVLSAPANKLDRRALRMRAIARRRRAKQRQDKEDEAVAFLLLSHYY